MGVGVHRVGVVGILLFQGTQVIRRVRAPFDEGLLGIVQGGGLRLSLLGGGDEEGQVQSAAEADDAHGDVAHIHIAQLAVLELKEQAHQVLGGLAHAGPEQGDVAVVVAVAAAVVGGEGVGLPVLNGGEAGAALPYRGAHPADREGGVKVHRDLPALVGDGHLALPDVQTAIQGHHIVVFAERDAGEGGGAGIFPFGEVAPELQQDFAAQILIGGFIQTFRGVGVNGVFLLAVHLHRHHAVAVVAVGRVVGDLETQGGGGDVGGGLAGVVDGELVFPHGQLVGQHHLGGVVVGVDDKVLRGNFHAALAEDGSAVGAGEAEGKGAVLLLAVQHTEIGAGEEEMALAGGVDQVGGGAGEADLRNIPAGAGAENPHRLAAQQILGLESGGGALQLVDLEGQLAVGRVLPGLGVKVKGQALLPLVLNSGQLDEIGVEIVGLGLQRAVLVVGGNLFAGIDHYPHLIQGVPGDVLQGGVYRKVAVVGVCGSVVVECESGGQAGKVEGGSVRGGHIGVGEHTVVPGGGGAATLGHAAQIVVQGEGAVGGEVVSVVGGGEVEATVRRVVKHGGCQVVPVGKGHLLRGAEGARHVAVKEVGHHGGVLGVVIGEEAVLIAGDGGLRLHPLVAAAGLRHLVVAEVLGTQSGVHQQAQLHLGGGAGIFHRVVQIGHAVLGGAGVGQPEDLGDGDAVHRPGRPDFLRRGGDRHSGGAGVLAAEHIVLGFAVPGHPEGGKGGVILPQGEEQVLVVVILLDGIALQGADGEAAAAFVNQNLDVIVGQSVSAVQLRRQDGDGQQSRHEAQGEGPGQEPG